MLKGEGSLVGGRRQQGPVEEAGEVRFQRLRAYAGRGVVTTGTYEARALGVHSGMGGDPGARGDLLPADFDAYGRYSRAFKAAVAAIAPHIEDRGIDEIYIDLTLVVGKTVVSVR